MFFSETFEDAPDARRVRCLNSVPRRMSGAHARHRAGPHMSRPGGEPAQCVHRAVVGSRGPGAVTCVPAGGDVASSVRFARFACIRFFVRGNRTLRQDFMSEVVCLSSDDETEASLASAYNCSDTPVNPNPSHCWPSLRFDTQARPRTSCGASNEAPPTQTYSIRNG